MSMSMRVFPNGDYGNSCRWLLTVAKKNTNRSQEPKD